MQEPMTGVLRSDVELIHGERPMLFDRCADAYFKVSEEMLNVMAFLTESMPISTFVEKLHANGIPISPEQLLQLLAFLQQNNLLVPEYGQIGMKRAKQEAVKEQSAFLRFSAAYLFFKLPPWRPERAFAIIAPYIFWLASKWMVILLLIPAVIGYLQMIRDFGNVQTTFAETLSWAGLAKYAVAILFMKLIHEAAHSIAAIHFKCRVRGGGIGFMVFYPRLYTDTTDSWRLPRKQRLLIDAAGIIIELLLGGIAVLLWTYLPPGAWKSTMFYIFAVSTLSTLLVNGNPCIRYDGYYILCDLLNIENLMTRSAEYVKQFWRWYLLRLGSKPRNERGVLLLVFGISSFFYRIVLYTSIILVIYHSFVKTIAIVMLVLELYSILIYPFWREVKTIRALSRQSANKARWYLAGVAGVILSAILFLPLSWNITLPGEVVPRESQLITIQESGFLRSALPRRAVKRDCGEILLQLDSPQLELAQKRLQGIQKYDKTLCTLQAVDDKIFAEALVTQEKIASNELSLRELNRQKNDLTIRAEMTGVFVPLLAELSAGAYLHKGQIAGEVVSESTMLYAYADDRQIGKMQVGNAATATVRDSLRSYSARIVAITPIAARLQNSPLLQQFGGSIPVYQAEGQQENYLSVHALYRIELAWSEPTEISCGRVATVKVHHREQLYKPIWQFLHSMLRKEF